MSDLPPRLPSLRRELARTLTVISTIWLAAVFLTVAFGIRHQVDDLMDGALQEAAEMLYGMLLLREPDVTLPVGSAMPAPPHDERLIWQIVDSEQQVVLRSHKAPATALLPEFKAGLSDAPGEWRVYAMRLPKAEQVLYVGQPAMARLESRYGAIAVVGASGVLIGLIFAFWMRRRVIQAMKPMQELSQQVKQYDPMRPGSGLPPSSRQEFVEIRQAIVDLGDRLAERAESEQAFAAHAAHALRTPLAGMEAQLAVAMREIPDTVRPRLERTREAVVRLKRVVTSMLALFRSQAELEPQSVNLAELLARLPVENLSVHVDDPCRVRADPNLLAAALMNLLDNAVRYGAHTCWVTCRSEGSSQSVTVRDDGPGLPPERCASLQASLDEPIEDGFFGLGLKLAALVARAHKGRLVIDGGSPARRGFSATLVLWADAAGT